MLIKVKNDLYNLDKLTCIKCLEKSIYLFVSKTEYREARFESEEIANEEFNKIIRFAGSSGISVYRLGERKC